MRTAPTNSSVVKSVPLPVTAADALINVMAPVAAIRPLLTAAPGVIEVTDGAMLSMVKEV